MIVEVQDHYIDTSKLIVVGPVYGDPAWLKYKLVFDEQFEIDFYEEKYRVQSGTHYCRDDFLKKIGWLK